MIEKFQNPFDKVAQALLKDDESKVSPKENFDPNQKKKQTQIKAVSIALQVTVILLNILFWVILIMFFGIEESFVVIGVGLLIFIFFVIIAAFEFPIFALLVLCVGLLIVYSPPMYKLSTLEDNEYKVPIYVSEGALIASLLMIIAICVQIEVVQNNIKN